METYALKHDKGDEALPLPTAYGKALDSVLDYMWKTATWREVKIGGRSRPGPFPDTGRKDEFEKSLRSKYLESSTFVAHWVESSAFLYSALSWNLEKAERYEALKKVLKIKSFDLGSASGLPTLPFSLTLYGGSRAFTAFDIMLRTSISSNLLNSSYFFQSPGSDLFPWFCSTPSASAYTGSATIERRERIA